MCCIVLCPKRSANLVQFNQSLVLSFDPCDHCCQYLIRVLSNRGIARIRPSNTIRQTQYVLGERAGEQAGEGDASSFTRTFSTL
jgi:hypothetical protein